MALSSKQKREMFRRTFGAELLPACFLFKEDRFVRVHPGQVLLGVGMDLSPSGGCYICFGAIPLCAGIDREIENLPQRVDPFMLRGDDPVLEQAGGVLTSGFESRFEMQRRTFFAKIYGRFSKIKDVDSLLSFQEWKDSILGYCDNLSLKMSEWIQIGHHEKAREIASLLLEGVEKARQSYLDAAAYNVKYAKNEAQAKMFSGLYDEHLRRLDADAERLTKRIAMIDAEQYNLLREEIDRNIEMSTKVLAGLYPEFY